MANIWHDLITWVGGITVTDNHMNEQIRDNLTYIKNVIDNLSSSTPSVNLVKNYPSIEGADGSQPVYFDVVNDPVLTEEDATGESIQQLHERVLKFVVSADGGDSDYAQQTLTIADEPLLDASVTTVSFGIWVYNTVAGTVTVELYDDGGSILLGTDTTTEVDQWVWLEILNVTIGTTSITWRVKHSENDAVIYMAMPTLSPAAVVGAWQQRKLIYRESFSVDIGSPQASWTDLDCSSYVSGNAAIINFLLYAGKAAASTKTYMRRNGDTTNTSALIISFGYAGSGNQGMVMCDEDQIVEYYSSNTETWYELYIVGYWEWE